MTKPYLIGALHDATERKNTFRISQKSKLYIDFLAKGIHQLGSSAWTYQEGKSRNIFVVEFSKKFLTNVEISNDQDKCDYLRGFFDTDGGIAKQPLVRYYIYYAQKDFEDIKSAKQMLENQGIVCGKIHNPSKRIDPNYWRFYISSQSYITFTRKIGSWHPEKKSFLRMKI